MTPNPACCGPMMNLKQAATLMAEHDCGALPVVDTSDSERPMGIITDRDIVTRTLAQGQNPQQMRVADAMTSPVEVISPEASVEECIHLMEAHQIRRVVVMEDGHCVGVVSQADLARRHERRQSGKLLERISKPSLRAAKLRRNGHNGHNGHSG